jgi:hypothetical protein
MKESFTDVGNHLQLLKEYSEWAKMVSEYDSLHKTYLSRLNPQIKEQVHEMFKKDQKKALGALFRIGQKSKRRYSEKKFAPHSEHQLEKLEQILNDHELTSYGFLGTIPDGTVFETINKNRANIGLRSIDLRNNLIDVENETGINLHLPKGWQNGKITAANKW